MEFRYSRWGTNEFSYRKTANIQYTLRTIGTLASLSLGIVTAVFSSRDLEACHLCDQTCILNNESYKAGLQLRVCTTLLAIYHFLDMLAFFYDLLNMKNEIHRIGDHPFLKVTSSVLKWNQLFGFTVFIFAQVLCFREIPQSCLLIFADKRVLSLKWVFFHILLFYLYAALSIGIVIFIYKQQRKQYFELVHENPMVALRH